MRRGICAVLVVTLAVTVGSLSGCATTGPSYSEAPAPTLISGKAVVYVFRKYAEPTAWGTTIYFDDREVTTLNQRGFTWAYLTPGKHKIRGVWPSLSSQRDSFIDLDAVAGQKYYIELTGVSRLKDIKRDMWTGMVWMYFRVGSGFSEVRPDAAKSILTECCKYKEPRSWQY